MNIRHDVIEGIERLGFRDEKNRYKSVDVIPPGTYKRGISNRDREIRVIHGALVSGEKTFTSSTSALTFKKGQEVEFFCEIPTAIFCSYY